MHPASPRPSLLAHANFSQRRDMREFFDSLLKPEPGYAGVGNEG